MKLAAAGLLVTSIAAAGGAQQPGNLDAGTAPKPKTYVIYAAEAQDVKAGKPGVLELHFRVADGFHVNSHTPRSELLIPTQLNLQPGPDVKPGKVEYPAGTAYSFSFEPDEKLDVYTGAFTVKVPVAAAAAGEHALDATLRYQACDHAACYPPKSLPVHVVFRAR